MTREARMTDSWREKLRVHPAAEAFPLLSDDDLQELAEDIKVNGVIEPIMLDAEGALLLDGRNRLAACRIAEVEPRYEQLASDLDPLAYIVSRNIRRRNITKGQQALALPLIYPGGEQARG